MSTTTRNQRVLDRIDMLLRGDTDIDGPEAHVSYLVAGLTGIRTLLQTPDEIDVPDGMTRWSGGDGPPADWNGQGVLYANGVVAQPLDEGDWRRPAEIPLVAYVAGPKPLALIMGRDAIARIIDDEDGIWTHDGEYPLERERIASRRRRAYERADRILGLPGRTT